MRQKYLSIILVYLGLCLILGGFLLPRALFAYNRISWPSSSTVAPKPSEVADGISEILVLSGFWMPILIGTGVFSLLLGLVILFISRRKQSIN